VQSTVQAAAVLIALAIVAAATASGRIRRARRRLAESGRSRRSTDPERFLRPSLLPGGEGEADEPIVGETSG
jgi:hypothetical protein